ncbi:MAG: porin [Myxococcales bacterium]|nr:porin [Myxococcales bacterium]
MLRTSSRAALVLLALPTVSLAQSTSPFSLGGYVEANYSFNFNRPSNGITHFRGFDNRHNTFTLSNVVLDAGYDNARLIGRLALQVGQTPSTYYLAEPSFAGADASPALSRDVWKYIQQAYGGYRFDLGHGLTVLGGVFLSPIGPESMPVRENFNASRSNLFFGLPFYHTGVRVSYPFTESLTVTLSLFNGWNSLVDNNPGKSVNLTMVLTRPWGSLTAQYFGGNERAQGAAEGAPWRHMLDAYASVTVSPRLSVMAQVNGGFEQNRFGTSRWFAAALYGRVQLHPRLFAALRGDVFIEHTPENAAGRASPIFWPAPWVSSGTATLDYRPHPRASFRAEFRHDEAGAAMYYGGAVEGDGGAAPYVANRRRQDTLSAWLTTWF